MSSLTRPVLARVAVGAGATALLVVAFLRGDYLLGSGTGICYVVIVAALMYLILRSSPRSQQSVNWQRHVTVVFALGVAGVLAFPAFVSPGLRYSIDNHALDRSVRNELYAVFSSDPRFANLSVSTIKRKSFEVTISGSVNDASDLSLLRTRIRRECELDSECWLKWDVFDRTAKVDFRGSDVHLFKSDAQSATASK